jgi:hypothetical protein
MHGQAAAIDDKWRFLRLNNQDLVAAPQANVSLK